MSTQVTLTLPDDLYERALQWSAIMQRDVPETLADALDIILTPIQPLPDAGQPVGALSDEEVLALCQRQMAPEAGERLNCLLEKQREGELSADERHELLALMQLYNQLWLRQSEALAEAVSRRLRPPLQP
jgi:hypothetical protein